MEVTHFLVAHPWIFWALLGGALILSVASTAVALWIAASQRFLVASRLRRELMEALDDVRGGLDEALRTVRRDFAELSEATTAHLEQAAGERARVNAWMARQGKERKREQPEEPADPGAERQALRRRLLHG